MRYDSNPAADSTVFPLDNWVIKASSNCYLQIALIDFGKSKELVTDDDSLYQQIHIQKRDIEPSNDANRSEEITAKSKGRIDSNPLSKSSQNKSLENQIILLSRLEANRATKDDELMDHQSKISQRLAYLGGAVAKGFNCPQMSTGQAWSYQVCIIFGLTMTRVARKGLLSLS